MNDSLSRRSFLPTPRRNIVSGRFAIRANQGVARVESTTNLRVVKDSSSIPIDNNPPALDAVNLALVFELERDGRLSYAEVAPTVGRSETAVRATVLQLLETGAISVTALVDRAALGIELETAFTLEAVGSVRAAAERVAEVPEVVFLAITAGPFDVVGNLSCQSRDHALEAVDRIRALPEVETVTSLAHLRTVREAYPSVTG